MIIKLDSEAHQALSQICDMAIKYSGLNGVNLINTISQSMEMIEDPKKEVKADKKEVKKEK